MNNEQSDNLVAGLCATGDLVAGPCATEDLVAGPCATEDLVAGPCATELGMQGEYRCARVSVSELVSAGVLTDATYCFITVMISSDSVNELGLRLI